jgi:hypothetical protein
LKSKKPDFNAREWLEKETGLRNKSKNDDAEDGEEML